MERLHELGVDLVLGERVVTWPDEPEKLDGKVKVLRTDKGRQFEADLIVRIFLLSLPAFIMDCCSSLVPVNNLIPPSWPSLHLPPSPQSLLGYVSGLLCKSSTTHPVLSALEQ